MDWKSQYNKLCTWSTFESETAAGAAAVKRLLYFRKLQTELYGVRKEHNIVIPVMFGDNKKSIDVAHTGRYEGRSAHMELRYYGLSERVLNKQIELVFIRREENPSDLLTHVSTPAEDWNLHIKFIVST